MTLGTMSDLGTKQVKMPGGRQSTLGPMPFDATDARHGYSSCFRAQMKNTMACRYYAKARYPYFQCLVHDPMSIRASSLHLRFYHCNDCCTRGMFQNLEAFF
eukprot:4260781-Amphidinium_carterae.1